MYHRAMDQPEKQQLVILNGFSSYENKINIQINRITSQ